MPACSQRWRNASRSAFHPVVPTTALSPSAAYRGRFRVTACGVVKSMATSTSRHAPSCSPSPLALRSMSSTPATWQPHSGARRSTSWPIRPYPTMRIRVSMKRKSRRPVVPIGGLVVLRSWRAWSVRRRARPYPRGGSAFACGWHRCTLMWSIRVRIARGQAWRGSGAAGTRMLWDSAFRSPSTHRCAIRPCCARAPGRRRPQTAARCWRR